MLLLCPSSRNNRIVPHTVDEFLVTQVIVHCWFAANVIYVMVLFSSVMNVIKCYEWTIYFGIENLSHNNYNVQLQVTIRLVLRVNVCAALEVERGDFF